MNAYLLGACQVCGKLVEAGESCKTCKEVTKYEDMGRTFIVHGGENYNIAMEFNANGKSIGNIATWFCQYCGEYVGNKIGLDCTCSVAVEEEKKKRRTNRESLPIDEGKPEETKNWKEAVEEQSFEERKGTLGDLVKVEREWREKKEKETGMTMDELAKAQDEFHKEREEEDKGKLVWKIPAEIKFYKMKDGRVIWKVCASGKLWADGELTEEEWNELKN